MPQISAGGGAWDNRNLWLDFALFKNEPLFNRLLGKRGCQFFAGINQTGPSNSCSWGYKTKMKRTIEIIIAPTGEIQIDAVGFKGADCEQATKFLEEALGVVGKKINKPEYHQSARSSNQQRVGG
jgi:hypothetical protein